MQIVLLIGTCSDTSSISTDRLVTHEFGKDLNTSLLLTHLTNTFPSAKVTAVSITLSNYKNLIDSYPHDVVFVNLCDGVETDGYPGLSIVSYLHAQNRLYTGSGPEFYLTSTSKTLLKSILVDKGVDTCVYKVVDEESDMTGIDFPVIVKPSVSYGSMLISTKSIVDSKEEVVEYIKEIRGKGYTDEIFVETFLPGREFTVLCSGSGPTTRVYLPAERVFEKGLKERERILTYDICWMGCDMSKEDGEVPPQPYEYHAAPVEYQQALMDLAKKAYIAVGGTGYGRVDIRTKTQNDTRGFVLEVNANCGLAFGKMASSLGEILVLSKVEPGEFLNEIISFAQTRFQDQPVAGC